MLIQQNSTQYPQAFAEIQQQRNSFAEEAEDDENMSVDTNVNIPSTSSSTLTLTPRSKLKNQISEKKKSIEVGYVKMEQSPENGKLMDQENRQHKRSSYISNSSSTENSNNSIDSSDFTSDTG